MGKKESPGTGGGVLRTNELIRETENEGENYQGIHLIILGGQTTVPHNVRTRHPIPW